MVGVVGVHIRQCTCGGASIVVSEHPILFSIFPPLLQLDPSQDSQLVHHILTIPPLTQGSPID